MKKLQLKVKNIYGLTKLASEMLMKIFYAFGIKYLVNRCSYFGTLAIWKTRSRFC